MDVPLLNAYREILCLRFLLLHHQNLSPQISMKAGSNENKFQ